VLELIYPSSGIQSITASWLDQDAGLSSTTASVAVRRPQLFRRVRSREYRSFVAQGVNRLGARDRQRVSEHRRQRDEKY
jgi:hypothetical protein